MPPRPPVQGRRTAPRRAAHVSNIGKWITNAMLIHAIEQYQGITSTTCRQINSHAGPLESRRRASKRHMTGLMPTPHTFPPIWQFDIASTTLQWEAPTSQEYRRKKRDSPSAYSLVNKFFGWIGNLFSTEKTHISTPVSPSETVDVSEAVGIGSSATEAATISEQQAQGQISSISLPEEIALLRSTILSMDATIDDTQLFSQLYEAAKVCRRSLRRRIERRDLSSEALLHALEPLDSASRSRIPTAEMANKTAALIRREILHAMVDVHRQNPAAISGDLWLAFINRQCTTNGNAHDIELFQRLLQFMPESLKDHLSAERIRNLTCRLVTAQAHRHNVFPHWLALASRFSQALHHLPAQRRQELDHDMSAFLSEQDLAPDEAKRMRYAWLVIAAHNAHTNTQSFVEMYRGCLGPAHRLNGLQRWHVIFARLSAVQIFDAESRKQLIQREYTSSHERWSTLLAHAMLSSNKDTALHEFIAVLTATGEFASTIRALTFPPVHELRRDMMEALATACDNHVHALTLHDSIDMKPRGNRTQPLWSWTTWTKHVEAIIKDPAIDPTRIWQILKLSHTPRAVSSDKQRLAREKTAKLRLLIHMAGCFIKAEHLTDRQVLRNIQRCLNMHRVLSNGGVPPQILVHIVDLISRDLEKGQRGRTTRMEWLVRMVWQKYGPEEAKRAALAWNGWRWTIARTRGPSSL